MKTQFFQKNVNKLLSERNAWIGIAVVMAMSTGILSVALFHKNQKVILVPPHLTKSFWVQGDKVSREYLEEMGVHLALLLLDLSPGNLSHNHSVLLRYATPEAYGSLKRQFLKEAEEYASLQLSTHFKPIQVTANSTTLEVEVKGILTSYVAGKELKSSPETVWVKFTHRGSGLLLERALRIIHEKGEQEGQSKKGTVNE